MMSSVQIVSKTVSGTREQATSAYLDPFHIFKGKLRAAATRGKFHDSTDLRWLEAHMSTNIVPRIQELDLTLIGLAIKRYPELELMFARMGVNIQSAKAAAQSLDPNSLGAPQLGDVQSGLLR
jgi:hypothetical protein